MHQSSSPLRFAIVGTGGISRTHWRGFAAYPDKVKLVSACDSNPTAQAVFGELCGSMAPQFFSTHQAMIKAGGFDAAIITLPHYLHYPVAKDFIEAGIPCLIEKPVTCGLDELRSLRELADRKKVIVAAGQNRRFNRDATWIRRWVNADPNNFGELLSFDLQAWQNIFSYIGGPEKTSHWILDKKTAGGGVVISLAIHQIDFMRYVFGVDYTEVMAHGRFDAPFKSGAESCASALFSLSNGGSGTLHAQYMAPRVPYCESMKAYGTNGAIVQQVPEPVAGHYEGEYYFASTKDLSTTAWTHQFSCFARVRSEEVAELDPWSFHNQLVQFAESVKQNTEPQNSLSINFNTIAAIDALYESLRTGKAVRVATS